MTFVNRTSRTSDKSNVRFRARTQAPGLSEAYLWGKGELEDMLYQPKNDDVLFTFFGVSRRIRQRSLSADVCRRLAGGPTRLPRYLSRGRSIIWTSPCGRAGLRGMLILSLVSARRQYLAGRVSAGRVGICNETLRSRERLNSGHLRHRGFISWTACCVLARDIRHNQPQRSTIPTLKRANDPAFPLYRQKVRAKFRCHANRTLFGRSQIRCRDYASHGDCFRDRRRSPAYSVSR